MKKNANGVNNWCQHFVDEELNQGRQNSTSALKEAYTAGAILPLKQE